MNRRPLRRIVAAGAASVLLLGGATACGSDSENATDEPQVAAGDTEDGSEPVDVDLPGDGENVEPSEFSEWMVAGLEDSTTAHLSMATDVGMGSMDVEGQVDYTQSPVEMAMTVNLEALGGDPMDLRLVDGAMYLNMGGMTNQKFIKFDLSDASSLPPGMEGLGDQMDPLAAFRDLGDALEEVAFVGAEDVDGEELQHFTVTMDTTKVPAMAEAPPESGVPETVDYDLWFDEEFRIRQMVMDLAAGGGTAISIEAKIFDWDEPVTIEEPSPDQITDAPAFATG